MRRVWIWGSILLLAISTAGGLSHWFGGQSGERGQTGSGGWLWFARGSTAGPAPMLPAGTGAVIAGQAYVQAGGQLTGGLAGVDITIPELQLQTTTDSQGHYEIAISPTALQSHPGTVITIVARKPGYTRYDGEIRVASGHIDHKFSMREVHHLPNPVGKHKWLNRE